MESSFKSELFIENLLDFSSDIGEEDEDDAKKKNHHHRTSELDHDSHPMLAAEEEELEWLSNRDAFPPIETFDYILSETDTKPNLPFLSLSSPPPPQSKNHSPVSVLGTSNFHHFPVQARSKRRRKRRTNYTDVASGQKWWWCCEPKKRSAAASAASSTSSETYEGGVVRKCQHCQAEKTPQWRAGPFGPKTLCNACGVRYKSGRLFPEYRPANSPSFSSRLHSNSHRKILDMRKQKQKQVVMQSQPMPSAFDYGF